jgi:hypothetical protein
MQTLPLRLAPGVDLCAELMRAVVANGGNAAFVLSGVGSLRQARLRYAGVSEPTEMTGDLEILTLAGTLSQDGPHLHMSVSDANGAVLGGHALDGCIVRTTAEVLLAILPDWQFTRESDARTGFAELVIRETD